MSTTTTNRTDVYTRVTNRIVEELERRTRPWFKPWNAEHAAGRITRPLRFNGERYSGINVLMLWAEAETKGFAAPIWMTFQQARQLSGFVKKGEHGSPVVYASKFKKNETDDAGQELEREIPFLKEYTVFNVEQIEGLPDWYYQLKEPPKPQLQRVERADRFFANTKAKIKHGGNQAYYANGSDHIQMPPFVSFRDAESYCATLAHELTHWTKHASRLNREFGRKRWGDEGYAMEELVAELGSAFLSADLRLTPEVRDDHAGYVANWLKVLKDDKRAVFSAASHASRAVDFLHNLQPVPATA